MLWIVKVFGIIFCEKREREKKQPRNNKLISMEKVQLIGSEWLAQFYACNLNIPYQQTFKSFYICIFCSFNSKWIKCFHCAIENESDCVGFQRGFGAVEPQEYDFITIYLHILFIIKRTNRKIMESIVVEKPKPMMYAAFSMAQNSFAFILVFQPFIVTLPASLFLFWDEREKN